MTRNTQKVVAGTLTALGIALVVSTGVFVYEDLIRLRFAENLTLREKPRSESHWQLIETKKGHLIRPINGKFKNWYLAGDFLVNSVDSPTRLLGFSGISRLKPGPYVRNLILRERVGEDCYWKLTQTGRGQSIQSTHGPYKDWHLDFLERYIPETGSDPPMAWNLVLNKNLVEGAHWKLTETDSGHLIQATAHGFKNWYLDYLPEAHVLERNRYWGDDVRRDGPAPPLASSSIR